MINLLNSNIDVVTAKKAHLDFFKCYVTKRLLGTDCNHITVHIPHRRENSKSVNFDVFVNFVNLNNNLNIILSGNPIELKAKHDDLVTLINNLYGANSFLTYLKTPPKQRHTLGDLHKFFEDIRAVFNYSWFNMLQPTDDYSAYHLTKNLGVRSCIFCNRTYTITRTTKGKGKLMRPELDHWYPQSKYPLLAISFQNLIPCCTYCNSSVKGDIDLDPHIHIHPYVIETLDDDISFGYYYEKSVNQYNIFIYKSKTASGKAFTTLRKLKIDEMYNAHLPELEDLIKIKKAYSSTYIEQMAKFFPETGLSEQETYRILLGAELDHKNHHLMPMSKFKYDILKELGIIT